MESRHLTCLILGLALVCFGTLGCPQPPSGPIIAIYNPPKEVSPMVRALDPEGDPISFPSVEVSFPAVTDTYGVHYVVPTTLKISLARYEDGVKKDEWVFVEAGAGAGWDWEYNTEVPAKPIGITGSFNIGGSAEQSYGVYKLWVIVYNDNSVLGQGTRTIRVERPADQFVGGLFDVRIGAIYQSPGNCLVPDFVLSVASGQLATMILRINFPDGGDYPDDVFFPLPPPMESVTASGDIEEATNRIVFDPIAGMAIDLGYYVSMAGGLLDSFNCKIEGIGDGYIDGQVSDDDVDATIWMTDMSVVDGSSPTGTCSLAAPSESCRVTLVLDGNPYSP